VRLLGLESQETTRGEECGSADVDLNECVGGYCVYRVEIEEVGREARVEKSFSQDTLLYLPGWYRVDLGAQCLVKDPVSKTQCVRACGGLPSPLPGSQPVSVRCRARAPTQV
jgi:hypothetical protein